MRRGWSLPGLLAVGLGLSAAGCGSGSGGGVVQSPSEVTLIDVQARVFSPRCAVPGCHVGAGAPFGLDLGAGQSAGNLVGVASGEAGQWLRVEPYDAADSYLYMKLIGDPRILGDPMPASGGALSVADLDLVETWIDQGAM